ncbi:MAG TPA: arginine deiminase family protein [Thermoanaerobaculia bacterium]|nr:arginine deiminase family protein [Thermoanaerobaculia bacterium]
MGSETAALRRVALVDARAALRGPEAIAAEWRALDWLAPPDFDRALAEQERFVAALAAQGVEVELLPPGDDVTLDALYPRDASLVFAGGVVLCNMGKAARGGEPRAAGRALAALGLPLLGAITGGGRLEGGDTAWLDERTLAVGRGRRTNAEGIAQLRALLGAGGPEVLEVPLPDWRGPNDVFHLMSVWSPVDRDLAVVYPPLLPRELRAALAERAIRLVAVPAEEFDTLGCNVLALAPRRCLVLAGNPRTRRRLERAGAEVIVFSGVEICVKGGGGPTCLTRPLVRH